MLSMGFGFVKGIFLMISVLVKLWILVVGRGVSVFCGLPWQGRARRDDGMRAGMAGCATRALLLLGRRCTLLGGDTATANGFEKWGDYEDNGYQDGCVFFAASQRQAQLACAAIDYG